jgi:hypothetical protein
MFLLFLCIFINISKVSLFLYSYMGVMKWNSIVVIIYVSLVAIDGEHFYYLFPFVYVLSRNIYVDPFFVLKWVRSFYYCYNLYILYFSPSWAIWFIHISPIQLLCFLECVMCSVTLSILRYWSFSGYFSSWCFYCHI